MKRFLHSPLALVAVAILATLLFAGCDNKKEEPAKPAGNGEAATSEEATGEAAKADAPKAEFLIKGAHVVDESNSLHKGMAKFKEEVEQKSGGRIAVEIYPNGVLGGDTDLVDAVKMGVIQMAGPATTVLVQYVPEFGVLDMPFLFKSPQAGFKALDNELGAYLDKLLLEKMDIHNLGYGYNGSRSISNSKRPITSPADLEGLKIRVMESPIYIDTFTALGANPTPMSFGEVFTALQQGTVDGQDNAATLTVSARFYEVQKFYTDTGHTLSFLPMIINKKFYDSLPADLKQIVDEVARETMVDFQRQLEIDDRDVAVQIMKDKPGFQVDEVSPENYLKFVEAVEPVYTKNADRINAELLDLARKYNND